MNQMYCPFCNAPLKVDGQARLETLCEHVCCDEVVLKNKLVCSHECETSKQLNMCWNEFGEPYGSVEMFGWARDNKRFLSAYPSLSVQSEVESSSGVFAKKPIVLIDFSRRWLLQIEPNNCADTLGNIVRVDWRLKEYRNSMQVASDFGMFWFSITRFMRCLRLHPKFAEKELRQYKSMAEWAWSKSDNNIFRYLWHDAYRYPAYWAAALIMKVSKIFQAEKPEKNSEQNSLDIY